MDLELRQTVADASLTASGIFEAIDVDCKAFENGQSFDTLPLWPFPHPRERAWEKHREKLLALGPDWRFWADWYNNSFHGRVQDWDLLAKVALIDPVDWDKAVDHVNGLIQKIVVQHGLLGEARALKVEIDRLNADLQSLQYRSHNNPPGLVDETIAVKKELTIVWVSVDEAEKELRDPNPNFDKLASIGTAILRALKAIAAYCGSVADLAVKTSVKTAAAGITALLVATQHERLQAFAEGLIKFVYSFGG